MSGKYDDIIGLSRPASRHTPMSGEDRAAQFSPFAALTGHDAAIRETERLTEPETELGVDAQLALDAQIRAVADRIAERPMVHLRYFQPDRYKQGGAWLETTARAVQVDPIAQRLILESGEEICFEHLRSVELSPKEQ